MATLTPAQLEAIEAADLAAHGLRRGMVVGAHRWPYWAAHPDCWLPPWRGTIIARSDRRAWTGTLAFAGEPTQDEVDRHVSCCYERGYLRTRVPIAWAFDSGTCVYWQDLGGVLPYAEDLAQWNAARALEYARIAVATAALAAYDECEQGGTVIRPGCRLSS